MSADDPPVSASASAISAEVTNLAGRLQAALGDGYEVRRPLGSGGFAVVFLVRDLTLKRDLAVKVLSPDIVTTTAQVARFRREAEMIAGLSHPNIVPLHFVGGQGDLFYLAMQCVDGGSLADRLTRAEPLGVDEVIRAVTEVAAALAHAHKRGVVHRDIKPQNVLVDKETGRCLLTDFGIARGDDSGSLTATGLVVGTPAYLAPERIIGEKGDHRSDLYAVGVMAFELLTGRTPFHGGVAMASMMQRLAGAPPPVGTIRSDVPEALNDVISSCLATNPDDRVQSAGDIIRALTGVTPSTGRHPTRASAAKRRPVPRAVWIGLSVAGAAVAIGLAIALPRTSEPTAPPPSPAIDTNMVLIAAGPYTIGNDTGSVLARPAHVVRLPAFGIELHEVTVGDFNAFADSTGAPRPWTTMPDPRLPVTRVLWAEASNYCAWKHKDGGRLPTEEEWEAAARGAAGRAFPWGNAFDRSAANTAAAGRNAPAPVGSFTRGATPEGVYDLIGNVWEWTSSALQAHPGGAALPDSVRQYRVIRGGAHNTPSAFATAWHRGYARPATNPEELTFTGFRCAMTPRRR